MARSRHRTPIGLDVGARFVKAVQLAQSSAGLRVVAAAVAPRTVDADLSAPDAANPTALSAPTPSIDEVRAIGDLLYRGGFEGQRVILAAPAGAVLSGVLDVPPRNSSAPVEQIARLELARAHRCAADSFEMGCWDLPRHHRPGRGTQVMAVGLPHAPANVLLDAFEAGGFRVDAIDIGACAAARAAVLAEGPAFRVQGSAQDPAEPRPAERQMTAILDIGWSAAALTLVHRDTIVYSRLLSDGGIGLMHRALSSRLHLEPDVCEYLVSEVGLNASQAHAAPEHRAAAAAGSHGAHRNAQSSDAESRAILAAQVDATSRELSISFSYASQQYPEAEVTRLLLIGGGARMPGLAERLVITLGLEVRPVAPADLAGCEPGVLDACASPALTAAVGLALHPEL